MKTKIIGHRGAAGLALENSLSSIKLALSMEVDAVEFDVRLTKDSELVLSHDATLARVSNTDFRIKDLTTGELAAVKLSNGENVPTLREVLELFKETNIRAIIELKSANASGQLLRLIEDFQDINITVASFKHDELERLKTALPSLPIYLGERTKPLEIVQKARAVHADGIDLNFWLLNPLTYWQARRAKLDIMVYTVNSRFIGWFLKLLYPHILICTNYPNRFRHHASK